MSESFENLYLFKAAKKLQLLTLYNSVIKLIQKFIIINTQNIPDNTLTNQRNMHACIRKRDVFIDFNA